MQPPTKDTKFIILQGLKEHNRFFTTYRKDHGDYTKLQDGSVAYRILGYAESVDDAQIQLYGRVYGRA